MTKCNAARHVAIRSSARWRLALAAAALALLAGCVAPVPRGAGDSAAAERIDRAFALDKSITRIEIVNRHGEISVRPRDEAEVGLHAVVQRRSPDFAPMRLVTRRGHGILHIETAFASGAGRVDVGVYLPTTSAIALVTDDGRIQVKRREGAVEARSGSGAILAASRGRLDLRTDSGQIRAIAMGRHWSGESRIETGSGRIIVRVPTFGDITLDAATGGRLETDFGLSVHPRDGRNMAHARYGRGSSALVVRSASGQVVLDQLVPLADDGAPPEDDD